MEKAQNDGLIGKCKLLHRVPLSYTTVWNRMRRGEFPLSVKVGGRVFWHQHEVEAWLSALPRSEYLSPSSPENSLGTPDLPLVTPEEKQTEQSDGR
jgi:predicted DNA-binding transcriptional regulator AlpA